MDTQPDEPDRLFLDAPVPLLVVGSVTTVCLEVNDAACELLGFEREALISADLRELLHLQLPGASEDGDGTRPPESAVLLLADGSNAEFELSVRRGESGGRRVRIVALSRTGRDQALNRLARLHRTTVELAGATTMEEIARIVVDRGVEALGAHSGSLMLLRLPERQLEIARAVGYPAEIVERFRRVPLDAQFPVSDAIREGTPIFLTTSADRDGRYPNLADLRRTNGEGAMAAVPLVVAGEVIGGIGLNFPPSVPLGEADRSFILNLAEQCAQAIRRARLATELRRSHEDARFLADCGALLGSSLAYDTTLTNIATLVVPALADWCALDVLEPSGEIVRLSTLHEDVERREWAARVGPEVSPRADDPSGIGAVIRTGEPLFVPVCTAELIERLAPTERHARVWMEMGIRSAIVAPMSTHGSVFGALTLIRSENPVPYDEQDLRLALDLASRAAFALENARLMRQTEAASRAKSDFLAVISHELRTPLNAILGYTDLLDSGFAGAVSERGSQFLSRIRSSSRHLNDLIEEVLTFSRLQAGRERIRLEEFDPRAVAREAAEMVEPLASAKSLALRTSFGEDVPPVVSDPKKLRQILLNLLGNAINFTDEGAVELSVERSSSGAQVLFRVRDTGIGIDPAHLERIFEPFWQADQGLTRRARGTGLGLPVSRELARLLEGDLVVKSEPGQGSTFLLRLPAALS